MKIWLRGCGKCRNMTLGRMQKNSQVKQNGLTTLSLMTKIIIHYNQSILMSSLFLRRCSIFPLFEFSFTCHLFSTEPKGIFTPTYWNMITSWHKLQSGCKLLHNKTRGNIEYHGKRTSHFMLSLPELLHWSNHASLQHCFPRNVLLFLREPFRQRRYVFFTPYAIGLDISVRLKLLKFDLLRGNQPCDD